MSDMCDVETIVVGAGVVGLAVARTLALRGQEVIVLERHRAIGMETSSRNSEVIHAGIYYPAGSLKTRLCIAGRRMLYDYCAANGIAHRRLGKLIVATTEDQLPVLAGILQKAAANGVDDLQALDGPGARALEPALSAVGALLSPSTGIVDSHGLMQTLEGEAAAHGAQVVFDSPVAGVAPRPGGGFAVTIGTDTVTARRLVLAGGLAASQLIGGLESPAYAAPQTRFARGHYFSLPGRSPFSRLIYPVPEPGGLGVHLTLDLQERARFGPDVEWIEALDYSVDPRRAERFYAAIRRYWPGLADGVLQPDYAGIRPKLSRDGEPNADFAIHGAAEHGHRGLVALFGIESPGLTASLAIAAHVADLVASG